MRKLLRDFVRPNSRAELSAVDFKEGFDASTRAWGDLLKDILAMANSGGGIIIFGVTDDGHHSGLNSPILSILDPARVSDKVRRYSPAARIETSIHELRYRRKLFGFLRIRQSETFVVFDSNYSYKPDGSKTQRQIFGPGIVYVRRPGGNTEATQVQLYDMIERISQRRVQQFLARIDTVARLPSDMQLIARNPSSPESGFLLQGDGTGFPVRITDQPDALPVSVIETIDPEAPFGSLNAQVAAQVRHWKQGDPSHRVNRATLIRWYLSREELNIDDDIAEFALLSSGSSHGFPVYWASVMSTDRLGEVLARELGAPSHPMIDHLPYLVGCFCWDNRIELLTDLESGKLGYANATRKAKRVLNSDNRDECMRSVRFSGATFEYNNERLDATKIKDDLKIAEQLFDEFLELDNEGKLPGNLRSVAHQLDILLRLPPKESK